MESMVQSWHNKRKRSLAFSDLPEDLIENIFSFLPIKLETQIGVLSKRFKRSWLWNRDLDFGKEFSSHWSRDEFSSIVDRILMAHTGTRVRRLCLFFDPLCNSSFSSKVEEWIQFALVRGVEELDLDFSKGNIPFLFPSPLLENNTSVAVLKLSRCNLGLSPTLEGLHNLTTLSLRRVVLSGQLIQGVLWNCLLLEKLDLISCSDLSNLKISVHHTRLKRLMVVDCFHLSITDLNAPKLYYLRYRGSFSEFTSLFHLPMLRNASLSFSNDIGWMNSQIKKLLLNLTNVCNLRINNKLLESIAPHFGGDQRSWMQISFTKLKEFHLCMEGRSFVNALDIAHFLVRCPSLSKFSIDLTGFHFECGTYWELHGQQKFEQFGYRFCSLKSIKVHGFKLHEQELLLVKLFMKKACVLETLALFLAKNFEEFKIMYDQRLYNLPRLSPNAKLVIREHPRGDGTSPIIFSEK